MTTRGQIERGTVAYIPARLGSKRVPRKNLRPLGGLPLVAHARFSVVTRGHKLSCDERQPILEPMDRTSRRSIETPNDNFDKRPGIRHVTFVISSSRSSIRSIPLQIVLEVRRSSSPACALAARARPRSAVSSSLAGRRLTKGHPTVSSSERGTMDRFPQARGRDR